MKFVKRLFLARRRRQMSRAVWAAAFAYYYARYSESYSTTEAAYHADSDADIAVLELETLWRKLDHEAP
jgi:hypothetical protein